MNLKPYFIKNWPELAREAGWSALAMAKKCGVSTRTLQRFFLKKFGKCPQSWIAEQRRDQAMRLLRDGFTVAESAKLLGYKHASNFSRKFPRIKQKLLTKHRQCQTRQIMSEYAK